MSYHTISLDTDYYEKLEKLVGPYQNKISIIRELIDKATEEKNIK